MKRPRQYIAAGGRVKLLFPFLHTLTIFCTPAYAVILPAGSRTAANSTGGCAASNAESIGVELRL